MSKIETRVIQVTNVAPTTTKDQLKTLFQFIGRIREIKLFPPEGSDQQVAAKVSYVEFDESTSAGVSLHLTNTVFIDRALIVVPVMDGKIPDERVAMQLTPQTVARMTPGQPAWPANVVSQLTGTGSGQVITTYDPRLNALGLPQYPPLPASMDAAKVEEIRRTVYIGNLDHKTTAEELIGFFSQAGEVKYVRMAGDENSRGAYLEVTDQRSVATCLGYNGVNFSGRVITVSHAKACISKPLSKSQEASRREVEEAMKKVKEAQSLISAAAGEKSRSRSRSRRRSRSRGYSRSRSRSRRRSRSRSRGRRRRSRSRSRRKSRSPRRIRRSRSRSPRRRRSRSRRRRSRSNSRPRRRTRSRSRRRSRTPPRAYSSRRSRSRSRGGGRKSRSRSRRRSRSRSRGGGSKVKDRKDHGKESEKKKKWKKVSASRSPSPPTLQREEPTEVRSDQEGSPAKLEPSVKGKAGHSELPASSEAIADKKPAKRRDRSKSPVSRRRKSPSRSPVRGSRNKRSGSRSPGRGRRRSNSPRKRRSKSRSPRRSRSPAKKKKARSPRRSRSGSRHRSKKDKKKERSRSRDRERDRKEKDKKRKAGREKRSDDKEKEKEKPPGKVVRDYDEEEKGFNSGSDHEEEMRSQGGGDQVEEEERPAPPPATGDQQPVDMDTSD